MNIEIDRDEWLSALRVVKTSVKRGSDVRVEAVGDLVYVVGGGPRSLQVSVRVPATVREEGVAYLPHALALKLAQGMPHLPVRISNELMPDCEGSVLLGCGIGQYRLQPTAIADETEPPLPAFAPVATYPSPEFFRAFRTAAAFASSDRRFP